MTKKLYLLILFIILWSFVSFSYPQFSYPFFTPHVMNTNFGELRGYYMHTGIAF